VTVDPTAWARRMACSVAEQARTCWSRHTAYTPCDPFRFFLPVPGMHVDGCRNSCRLVRYPQVVNHDFTSESGREPYSAYNRPRIAGSSIEQVCGYRGQHREEPH
jgi:hypothetical protein